MARLALLRSVDPHPKATVNEPIDILTDFERGAERIPPDVAERLRGRQRAVAGKRRRAQLNESLLRFRVRGRRRQLATERRAFI
jgi:hypothetical protein